MGWGRHFRRAFRGISRGWRRIYREGGKAWEDVGKFTGDVLTGGALTQKKVAKQASEQAERMERERQEQIETAERNQKLEEDWAKKQSALTQNVMNTQVKGNVSQAITGAGKLDFINALGNGKDEDEEDLLKRMLKNK